MAARPPPEPPHALAEHRGVGDDRLLAPRGSDRSPADSPPSSGQLLLAAGGLLGSSPRLAASPPGSSRHLLAAGPPSSGELMSEATAEALYDRLLVSRFAAERKSKKCEAVDLAKEQPKSGGMLLQAARQPSPLRVHGRAASPCGGGPPTSKADSLLAPRRAASPAAAASPPRASCSRAAPGTGAPAGPGARRHGVNCEGKDQENSYLRRNIEHLRLGKRQLEAQVANLNIRVQSLQEQNRQYRAFCEQPRAGAGHSGGRLGMEMDNLQEKLTAVQMLKDALNTENLELQRRLEAALENLRTEQKEQRHTQCVVCLDNLANIVCLPCKHLALCSLCGAPERNIASCPICRTSLSDRLQVFMP
ncbi:unnamed protein product [Prorocentrum cordatum]|uniref:RING-type domain-containing protein n=1 Tax=Prorocentrum cordatum TaxID=2364126 RepID=A0ABN9R6Q0_9DINO|nr:unnamed protein product [Polarella glacialis]